jgi:large subunit ribosomal protein L4
MELDVVNGSNQKVGAVAVRDEVFGGRPNDGLVWESVVHANAAERRGTHATKNRALVSGGGKKPWKQKGTGRARVGSSRNPLWRKGGTVFGPQPRSYDFALPKKVERGALRAALTMKLREGGVVLVEALAVPEPRTKAAVALLTALGATGKTLVVDVALDELFVRSARNLPGVVLRQSRAVTARDVMHAERVVVTKQAFEKLQDALA